MLLAWRRLKIVKMPYRQKCCRKNFPHPVRLLLTFVGQNVLSTKVLLLQIFASFHLHISYEQK